MIRIPSKVLVFSCSDYYCCSWNKFKLTTAADLSNEAKLQEVTDYRLFSEKSLFEGQAVIEAMGNDFKGH